MFQSIGSTRLQPNPITSTKVYWSAVISKACYGMELQCLSDVSKEKIDMTHMKIAKRIQGLADSTANIVPLVGVKWPLLSSYIDQKCMTFMWQIMSLSTNVVHKKLFVYRICDIMNSGSQKMIGPTAYFVNLCQKYGMYSTLQMCLQHGNQIHKTEWNKRVKEKVKKMENDRWKASCMMYRQDMFKLICDHVESGWGWWKVGKLNCKLLNKIKIMWRALNVKSVKTDGSSCRCEGSKDIKHILFECEEIVTERNRLWQNVRHRALYGIVNEMEDMSAESKTVFIYRCFNVDIEQEWMETYEVLVDFVYGMWVIWRETVLDNG